MDPLWAIIFFLAGIFVGGVLAFVYLQRAYLEEFRSMAERLDRFERSLRPSITKVPDTRTDARADPRDDTKPGDQTAPRPAIEGWQPPLRGREGPLIAPPIPGLTPAEATSERLEEQAARSDGSAETLIPVVQPAAPAAVIPAALPGPITPLSLQIQRSPAPARPNLANARTPTLTDQPIPPRLPLSALIERGTGEAPDPASEQGLVSLPVSALRPIGSESLGRKADPTLPMALGEPRLPTAVAQAIQQRSQRVDDEVTQLDPALEPDMIAQLQAPRLSDEVIEPPLPSESSGPKRVFDEPSLPRVAAGGEIVRGAQAKTRVPTIEENADPQWVWSAGAEEAPPVDPGVNPDDQSSTTRVGHTLGGDGMRRDPTPGRKS